MDTITINRILQNLPPDARRRTHEAFDEERRVQHHLDEEVLSKDPEIGLGCIYRAEYDMHEPDDLPFSDVDPEEMMLREMGVYDE